MGLVGTLTVELFLMPDGSLVVNELAPRVHNSGHWSIEGAVTSQFEQHLRAICGLPLGSVDDARAGGGDGQPARRGRAAAGAPDGRLRGARPCPTCTSTSTTSATVFERRKMGHVTALGATVDEALGAGPRGGRAHRLGAGVRRLADGASDG